jgi:hypothetical protein
VWKLYSQSWSAWPRAAQGRLVIFMVAVLVVVDMLRMVCLGRTEDSAFLRLVEKATVTARMAMRIANDLAVKKDVDAVVVFCWVVASDIEREGSSRSTSQAPLILVSRLRS